MRSVYWFGRDEARKAAEKSKTSCSVVVPSIDPGKEAALLQPQWQPKLHGKLQVVQSESFQLSYTGRQSPKEPHWHRLQLESYSSDSPMVVVYVDIDERLRDEMEVKAEVVPAGRLFIPPRFCHMVHLTGLTEVMQLRLEPGSLERDNYVCTDCRGDNCRCDEMRELLKKTVAGQLPQAEAEED